MTAREYINNQLQQIAQFGRAGDYKSVKYIIKQTLIDWAAFNGDDYYERVNDQVQAKLAKAIELTNA